MLVAQAVDPVPGGGEHLEHDLSGLVRVAQHSLGDAQQPGARDLDELDQRLLIARHQAAAEGRLARQS